MVVKRFADGNSNDQAAVSEEHVDRQGANLLDDCPTNVVRESARQTSEFFGSLAGFERFAVVGEMAMLTDSTAAQSAAFYVA